MTIAEIKEKLSQERSFGSRFPVRIIFVENLNEYSVLEHQLKGICDVTMNVADFCRAPDTVPQFDKIRQNYPSVRDSMYCCFLWASICASVLSVSSILNIVSSERFGNHNSRRHQRPE